MTQMNEGLMIGKFVPMHKGHKFGIMEAAMRCHKLTVLLCIDHLHDPEFPSHVERLEILKNELKGFNNITVESIDCTSFPYAKEDDEEVSKYWAEELYKCYPNLGTLFGSEKYIEYVAKYWPNCVGLKHEIIDLDRKEFHISATKIRTEPLRYFDYLVDSAKPAYTKHILVIGSESCGKSTLVKNLSTVLKAPMVPEMYRSMFPAKGMDFTATDLEEVARAQNNAVKCQVYSPYNKGMIIHDTCNDVTLTYAKKYFPGDITSHMNIGGERSRNEVNFDLILFCDMNIPWENDGTRTLGGESERKEMRDLFFSVAAAKARSCGCPMVVLDADYKRIPDALKAIEDHLC